MTNETVLRPDPNDDDNAFERPQEREIPITNVRPIYKEDYKRTSREGRKVYVGDGHTLEADTWKTLPSRKQAERRASAGARQATGSASDSPRPGATGSASDSPRPGAAGRGATLSAKEAEELYEPFRAAVKDWFKIADDGLWLRCPQIDGRDIWGNVDDDETESLANVMLKGGQRNPQMAALVRHIINWADYAVVVSMFGPRIQQTVEAMRGSPYAGQPLVKMSLFRGRKKVEATHP